MVGFCNEFIKVEQYKRLNLTSTARHFILFELVVQGLRVEEEDPIDDSTLYLGCVGESVHCVDWPCVVTSWYLDI